VIGYLGLGSNVGDRLAHLRAARDGLAAHGVTVRRASSVYETEPQGEILDQPEFLNACLEVETELAPEELLDACKVVEVQVGRMMGGPRHGPRTIDVDLLLLGDVEHESERLRIPHRDVLARRFVLEPLLELDPGLSLPDGTRLRAALDRLEGQRVERAGSLSRRSSASRTPSPTSTAPVSRSKRRSHGPSTNARFARVTR
jgi:2-amino-4-hydroxy-6-hydroxymethyldihydropteridine diphosphokinase